ncbi:MAG TPA: hypothetical protein PKA00_21320 [Saprospiraceae bacterium]|nr:hypothetical protein [Saprospiraceae bacterium]HMQ85465.1 hypothetical protein [Saprospiraceae bacterium]
MNDSQVLMLMPHIKVVEAEGYFIVYDLAARKLFQAAEAETVLLAGFIKKSIADIQVAEQTGAVGLMQALETLIRDQVVFCIEAEELDQYPEIAPTYDSPSWIETLEVDVGSYSVPWIPKIQDLVFQLQPTAILFNLLQDPETSFLSFLNELPTGTVYIQLDGLDVGAELLDQLLRVPRVFGVLQGQQFFMLANGKVLARPFQIPKFNVNATVFRQSLQYHTYFYKRLYIDVQGAIKNAKELPHTVGHLADYTTKAQLLSWIQSAEFTRYWAIRKDECEECRTCCFRYACIDKRVPLDKKTTEGFYGFSSNCSYKK